MALRFDIRRATLYGLALVLFVAAAGAACLVSATSAVAMPGTHGPRAPMDCDTDSRGSMSACPHSEGPFKADSRSVLQDQPLVDAVVAASGLAPAAVAVCKFMRAEHSPSPPPSLITPLRI